MPHVGQGAPLPDFLQCDGEWIVEGYVYLCRSDEAHAIGGSAPRFTMGAARHDGAPCIGFSLVQLAAALHVDADTVLAANQDGSLVCLGTADVPPTRGGISATAYGFQIGDRKGSLTVETDERKGTA